MPARDGWKVLVAAAAVGATAWGAFRTFSTRGEPPAPLRRGEPVVVVELFSSEGCSSCPPADDYVARLDQTQPIPGVTIVALELHVDHWDRKGWTDPFGAAAFTRRQAAYVSVFEDKRTYTPQIVFDGHDLMKGGDEDAARLQIVAAAAREKAAVNIELGTSGSLLVAVASVPAWEGNDVSEVWLAITESHLTSDVSKGENAGRTLAHAPIVRELRKLGAIAAGGTFTAEVPLELKAAWRPRALRYVAFVQGSRSRRIVGAAAANAS